MAETQPTAARPHGIADSPRPRPEEPLALQAQWHEVPDGWVVRLPVRTEVVTLNKRVVVGERVVVRRRAWIRVRSVEDTVRREELRVETEGDARVVDTAPPQRRRRPARRGST